VFYILNPSINKIYFLLSAMIDEFHINPVLNTYQPQQNMNYQQYMPTTSNAMSTVIYNNTWSI